MDDLKRKVLDKNLLWDDSKVPEAKEGGLPENHVEIGESPASFRLLGARANMRDTNLNIFKNNI